MYATLGGDLVGMTGVPEVVLPGTWYLLWNSDDGDQLCGGISPQTLTHQEVLDVLEQNNDKLRKLSLRSWFPAVNTGLCVSRSA